MSPSRERPLQPPEPHWFGCQCRSCRLERAERNPDDASERFLPSDFTEEEIAEAQAALDFHPDNSPYWDQMGQDAMLIGGVCGLTSRTTNAERRELYRQAREAALREEEAA